ncbi:MAG: ribose-5-phosphate isomerase RpiA [Planctomycetales bacterium]
MAGLESEKELAARGAVALVQAGMRVGLGSGSTSAYAVKFLGERIAKEGLKIVGVPTSTETRTLATQVGIPLQETLEGFELDVAIDGADQATRGGVLIKGGGGAMLRERIVAAAAKQFVVIADSSKLVEMLGGFPLPVEVVCFGWRNAMQRLAALGCDARLRLKNGEPFRTDEGNFVIDCPFSTEILSQPEKLDQEIRGIAGVVEHGLFRGMAERLIVARGNTVEVIVF